MKLDRTLRTGADLRAAGLIWDDAVAAADAVAARYAVAVTPTVAGLIDRDDPNDPIALQYLPRTSELTTLPEERDDPIGDLAHSPVEGIVHRYPDRVLLKAVHVCPVYCRFCFRREMVGPEGLGTLTAEALDRALDYIAGHKDIWEVILTGGDPLVLSARRLGAMMERLAQIAHVKVVRIHTRVPVADPDRVDAALLAAIKASGKSTYLAVHANHPRELSGAGEAAVRRIGAAGIVLLSQSVLLRGVNDRVEVLADLMRRFVELGVRPYYLHHPDLAPGTAEFRLTIAEGQALVKALRGHVSGLCQPTYVLDIPGGFGKAPIAEPVVAHGEDGTMVTDFRGRTHAYPPEG
jgi:lysine 2,3-aminomutase